ncbi:hypothetical protein ACHAXA_009932 [Cyclostephanos tholiformis]|uniref:Carbohydrate sulfotransferase n=1 Tax=Cyclostephanos tholiformis TaxID=382380 RepID=A0ABD3RY34_9STRA
MLALLVNVSPSKRSFSPLFAPSSPPRHASYHRTNDGDESSSTSSSSMRRRRGTAYGHRGGRSLLPNDEYDDVASSIVRRSYAITFGALESTTSDGSCGDPGVDIASCVRSMLDEVKELSSSSSSSSSISTVENGVGGGESKANDNNTSPMSFPWWFVTLLRDAPVRATWHNLTIINPPIDYCTIEKVATTQWRNVQCLLNYGKNVSKNPLPCRPRKIELERRRKKTVGEGGSVSRAVMLRDPLERMLSGYLNKCVHVPTRKLEGHCEPNSVFNGTELTSRIRDDPRQLFAAYVDALPLKWNIHFLPQSMYCDGLFRHVAHYDFVGHMGANFYDELDRMKSTFRDGPGGDALADAIERVFRPSSSSSSSSSKTPVAMHLGGGRKRGYDAARHPTNAPEYVREYYTAASVRRALEYFAIDYVLLDLEIPSWVRDVLAVDVDAFGG